MCVKFHKVVKFKYNVIQRESCESVKAFRIITNEVAIDSS